MFLSIFDCFDCFWLFLTVFNCFWRFLTLLTIFGSILYTYERADCWRFAAFFLLVILVVSAHECACVTGAYVDESARPGPCACSCTCACVWKCACACALIACECAYSLTCYAPLRLITLSVWASDFLLKIGYNVQEIDPQYPSDLTSASNSPFGWYPWVLCLSWPGRCRGTRTGSPGEIIIILVLHFWIGLCVPIIMVMVSETASAYCLEQWILLLTVCGPPWGWWPHRLHARDMEGDWQVVNENISYFVSYCMVLHEGEAFPGCILILVS